MPEERKGELFVFLQVVLWGVFPVVTTLTYADMAPLASLAWSLVFTALFFGAGIVVRKRLPELANVELWRYACFIALFLGIMYYGLFFIGLGMTSSGNAALIAQFEIFTAFLFFNVFRKERISREHIAGGFLMALGAVIVLAPNVSAPNAGDLLILGATFCAPFGNLFQQKARQIASSETVMFLRTILTVPVIFVLAYVVGPQASLMDVRHALPFLILNGVVLLGVSKIFWIEGIHRVSVMKANALSSFGPLITLLFAWVVLQQAPTVWQFASLVPLMAGAILLTDHFSFKGRTIGNPGL
jgi:drug/metabolite transporter (DMT)-like permease